MQKTKHTLGALRRMSLRWSSNISRNTLYNSYAGLRVSRASWCIYIAVNHGCSAMCSSRPGQSACRMPPKSAGLLYTATSHIVPDLHQCFAFLVVAVPVLVAGLYAPLQLVVRLIADLNPVQQDFVG